MHPKPALLSLVLALVCLSTHAQSQSIPWHTIAGGGGTSTNGAFAIRGTIGQMGAGKLNGTLAINGGFWSVTAASPPGIATQPQNQTVAQGGSALFTVAATGTAPLSYQWRFNGTNISGATTNSFTRTNAQPAQAGAYSVVVTNNFGSITSIVATLTVLLPPEISVQPQSRTNVVGTTATFTVTATGDAPLGYEWRKGGVPLADDGNISGATNATLTLTNVQLANAGAYAVVIINPGGSVTSVLAALTIHLSTNVVYYGGNGSNGFGAPIGQGTLALSDDGSTIAGTITKGPGGFNDVLVLYIDSVGGGFSNTVTFADTADGLRKAISGFNGGGNRSVLTNPPGFLPDFAIALGPASDWFGGLWRLTNGGNNSLGFITNVNLNPVGDNSSPIYSFAFNVADIGLSPRCNCTIRLLGTYISTTGYRSDEALPGAVEGVQGWKPFKGTAFATYTISGGPPLITSPPASRTNGVGTTASFSVSAGGTPPVGYQWQLSGTNLSDGGSFSGATSPTLVLTNVQLGNAGGYTVVLSNSLGSVTSVVATLTVIAPPVILSQPQSLTSALGTTATFDVTAIGTIPLSYQWRRPGTNLSDTGNISGSASAMLTLTNIQLADAGDYAVVITNSSGSVTSAVATLTVTEPPVITIQPQSRTNLAGTDATFSVTATGASPLRYQWQKDGLPLTDGGNVSGATNAMLTLSNVQLSEAGSYAVVITNAFGNATSAGAILTVYLGTNVFTFGGNGSNSFGGAIGQGSLTLSDDGTTIAGTITRGPGSFNDALVIYIDSISGGFSNTSVFADAGDGMRRAISGFDGGGNRSVLTNPPGFLPDYAIALSPVGESFGGLWRLTNGGNDSLEFIAGVFLTSLGDNSAATYTFFVNAADLGLVPRCQCAFKLLGTYLSTSGFRSDEALPGQVAGTPGWNAFTGTVFATYTLAGGPPLIATPPASQTNGLGATANFTVIAGGTTPLSYRWRKGETELTDGGNISGATSAALALSNLQATDAGGYSVVVTNVAGSVTSVVAQLTVANSPVITAQPQSRTDAVGATIAFSVTVAGSSPLSYQWRRAGTNLSDAGNLSGTASATLTLTNLQMADAGSFTVVVTNSSGSITSAVASLTVIDPPVIVVQPQGQTNVLGTTAMFSVTSTGASPLSYQWQKGGVPLLDGGNVSGTTNATLTLANVGLTNAGDYAVIITNEFGSVTSANARLTIYLSPNAFSYGGNGSNSFGGAVGQGSLTLSDDGTTILGTVTKGVGPFNDVLVLYIDSVGGGFTNTSGFADAADGLRKAISGFDGGTNRSVLTNPPGFLPDYAIALSPVAESFGGLWGLTNGGDNSLGFIASVNLSPVGDNSAGTYSFTVNAADLGLLPRCQCPFKLLGTYISATGYRSDEALPGQLAGTPGWNSFTGLVYATHTIAGGPPLIASPPASRTNTVGTTASFSVIAGGTPPLSYQWQKGGTNLSDAGSLSGSTSPTLTMTNVQLADAGGYSVVVTNFGGSVTSSVAMLTVNSALLSPAVLSGPAYGPGGQFQFTLTGQAGATHAVQMSTNLATTNWMSLYTNTAPFVFVETNASNFPQRFYRALALP